MALFGPKPLPFTSYGYQPPRGATARGWVCTNPDCGAGEPEPVPRWPFRCRRCGWPADPQFDEPWAHEARGAELEWEITNFPGTRGEVARIQLLNWNLKDALRHRDAPAAAAARAAIRAHADAERREQPSWNPVFLFTAAVWDGLAAGDLDGAASDLCAWLDMSTGEGADDNNAIRHNARNLIDAAAKFLASPGGAAHPRAVEVRKGCLRIAEGAYRILNAGQQAAITAMARA